MKIVIAFNLFQAAESLADLVDGYCRLVTDSQTSLWNRTSKYFIYILTNRIWSYEGVVNG